MTDAEANKEANSLKSFASELFDDVSLHLSQVSHFGLLDEVLAPRRPLTRADYVQKHAELLLTLKQASVGIGLSRKENFPNEARYGEIQYLTGLVICQAWSVLLNTGHLFGTFATERSLLFVLDRDLSYREEFIQRCTAADASRGNRLRKCLENILDNGNLYAFHYLLACWRVSSGLLGLSESKQKKAMILLAAFIDPPDDRIKKLKEIFRRTRRLAYLALHEEIPGRKHNLGSIEAQDLLELFPKNALGESDWLSTTRWQLLERMDTYDNEQLFASAKSAAVVLDHIEAFQKWWKTNDLNFDQRLTSLFSRPSDWPQAIRSEVEHFAQIRLPTSLGWMNEVRLWLNDDQAQSPWGPMKFIITPTLADRVAKVDLYLPRATDITASILAHLIGQLSRAFSSHIIDQASHSLWSSTAILMSSLLARRLESGYRLQITPVPAVDNHAGFACAGASYEFARGRIKRFLPASQDEQRNLELRQLISICDRVLGWRTPCLIMIAKLEIVSESDDQAIGDIDGLACFPVDGKVRWLVMESKATNSVSGESQLRGYVERALGARPDIERTVIGPQTSWHCLI